MNSKLDIRFDIKMMGFNFYVPFIAGFFLLIYTIQAENMLHLADALRAWEITFPTLAAWWSIFLFRDIVRPEMRETILAYPVPRWKLGIARVGVLLAVYYGWLLVALTIFAVNRSDIALSDFISLAIQISAQTFVLSAVGFVSILLVKHAIWALFMPVLFVIVGHVPVIGIYVGNDSALPIGTAIVSALPTIVLGAVLFAIGHYLLSKQE